MTMWAVTIPLTTTQIYSFGGAIIVSFILEMFVNIKALLSLWDTIREMRQSTEKVKESVSFVEYNKQIGTIFQMNGIVIMLVLKIILLICLIIGYILVITFNANIILLHAPNTSTGYNAAFYSLYVYSFLYMLMAYTWVSLKFLADEQLRHEKSKVINEINNTPATQSSMPVIDPNITLQLTNFGETATSPKKLDILTEDEYRQAKINELQRQTSYNMAIVKSKNTNEIERPENSLFNIPLHVIRKRGVSAESLYMHVAKMTSVPSPRQMQLIKTMHKLSSQFPGGTPSQSGRFLQTPSNSNGIICQYIYVYFVYFLCTYTYTRTYIYICVLIYSELFYKYNCKFSKYYY